MTLPLPITPTTSPSPASGDGLCTEWAMLIHGIALGGILTLVILLGGACGGSIAYFYKTSKHNAKESELPQLRRSESTYTISGVRMPASPAPDRDPRASTALDGQYGDSFAMAPRAGADGLPRGPLVAEPERVLNQPGLIESARAVASAAVRSARDFSKGASATEEALRESLVVELRSLLGMSLEPLAVRVNTSIRVGLRPNEPV